MDLFNINEILSKHSHLLTEEVRDIGILRFQSSSSSSSKSSSQSSQSTPSSSSIVKNNALDLRFLTFPSLPREVEVPLGYEDGDNDNDNRKLVIDDVEIAFLPKNKNHNKKNPVITIDGYDLYPNNDNVREVLSVCDSNDNDITGLTISNDNAIKLKLEFVFKYNKEPQYIGRWLILRLSCHSSPDAITIRKTETLIGLKIQGTIGIENIQKKFELNIEAKPFIPTITFKYFDVEWPTYIVQTRIHDEEKGVSSPPVWAIIIKKLGLRAEFPVGVRYLHDLPFDLVSAYNEYIQKSRNTTSLKDIFKYFLKNDPPRMRMKYPRDPISDYISELRICSWMEEMQAFKDIAQYDDVSIKIKFTPMKFEKSNGYALLQSTIKKKGSNEGRPKITAGDCIRIRPTIQSLRKSVISRLGGFEMIGNIISYNLKLEEFTVLFIIPNFFGSPPYEDDRLLEYCNVLMSLTYHIRYTSDNIGFLLQRRSLDLLINNNDFSHIFPEDSFKVIINDDVKVLPLNNKMIFNEEQLYAIETICKLAESTNYVCSSRRLPPFIIYGPPGTGKTSTVVASILQIFKTFGSQKRILVCAPSDAAADVVCRRLIKEFDTSQILRLNYFKRTEQSVPIEIRRYCYFYENIFEVPSIDILSTFNVIVTTCVTAGAFLDLKFDIVMIDEASQASEIDCIIPLTLTKPGSLVVLAGDPEQLRSQNRSPIFDVMYRNESLQERLLKSPVYSSVIDLAKTRNFSEIFGIRANDKTKSTSSSSLGVFLTKNYRSHQSIFKLSSRLFYHSSLEEYGDKEQISRLLDFELLPNKEMGSLFIGVIGQHSHELDSPSFYNLSELSKTVEVCRSLLSSSSVKISTKDIGVICAFRSQILKLRILLRHEGMGAINVGDVFDFQGQEQSVIIISTVLSSRDGLTSYEQNGVIGLNGDHRKFNVAVTRGACMCIVIGNPYCLLNDSIWRQYLEYCDSNNSYIGDRLKKSDDDAVIASLLGNADNQKTSVLRDYYSDMPFYSMM